MMKEWFSKGKKESNTGNNEQNVFLDVATFQSGLSTHPHLMLLPHHHTLPHHPWQLLIGQHLPSHQRTLPVGVLFPQSPVLSPE
jgi:hypothetical protein